MAKEGLLDECINEFRNMRSAKSPNGYKPKKSPYQPLLLLSIITGYKRDGSPINDLEKIPVGNSGLTDIYSELKKTLDFKKSQGSIYMPLNALRNEDIIRFKIKDKKRLFSYDASIFSEEGFTLEEREKFEKEDYPLEENANKSKHSGGYRVKFGRSKKYWLERIKDRIDVYEAIKFKIRDLDYIYLVDDWIETIEDDKSCEKLIDAILEDERYFNKKGKEKIKDMIIDKTNLTLDDKKSKSETISEEEKIDTESGHRLSQDDLEEIIEEPKMDVTEILALLDESDDRIKSRLILALESSQDSEILEYKGFKDKMVDLILNRDEDLVRENLRSLIHTTYDQPTYLINKFLVLLNDDDPDMRTDAAESLDIFDTQKVNKHLIDRLYDESLEVRLSALKTLISNENYDPLEIEKALEDWKTSLRSKEEPTLDSSSNKIEKTKMDEIGGDEKVSIGSLTWKEAVKKAIKMTVESQENLTFTRQKLIDEQMDYIKKATGTEGKTPEQTLSRVLQELWKEENFISHKRKGVYGLQNNQEMGHPETKGKVVEKEKKQLLNNILEGDIEVREVKDEMIDYLKDDKFLKRLIDTIDDFDPKPRYQVINILSEFEKEIVLNKLVELLEDPNEWVREKSAEALKGFSKDLIISKVSDVLKNSGQIRSRKYATEILGEFDDEEVLKHLEAALEDEAHSVRKEAIDSIGKVNHERVKSVLKDAKESDYSDVRKKATDLIKNKDLDIVSDEKEDEEDEDVLEDLFP